MSFPRAPLKRFNEHVGCAPPPGTYDLKPGDVKGAVSFHKAERFKAAPKRDGNSTGFLPPPSTDVPMSPVRRTLSVDGLSDSSKKGNFQAEIKHQKLLEKEIRSLVQQRGEQDRRLLVLENELKKLEAKLLSAVREKTGLAANVVSFERQLDELKKTNEFLKSKVSADTTKKRINSLSMELMEARNKLDAKDKELSFLQISTEGKVKLLETDVEASKTTLNALKDRNKDLEELYQETKAQNEESEKEMDKLHAVIQELRKEIKALQTYLDAANEELQVLKSKLQDESEMQRRLCDAQEKLSGVEQKLEQCTENLHNSQSTLREKEQEVQKCLQELQECQSALDKREREWEQHQRDAEASQTTFRELEEKINQGTQELQVSQNTVRQQEQELARVREVLRRTEEELDQRVTHMNERCLTLEDEKARILEEGLQREQELHAEINSLKDGRISEMKAHEQLKEKHCALTQLLEEEKVHSDSLSSSLERMREMMETERKQLEGKLEEVLGELSGLEKQEQLQEEAIQQVTEEKHTLKEELDDARAKLERQNIMMKSLEGTHETAIKKLQEEHSISLEKIGDMAIELENTRKALSEQKGQAEINTRLLEEEVVKLSKQLQEEQQKHLNQCIQEQHTALQGMLQEVQTRLVESEEEARRSAEAHNTERCRLQVELLQEREEKCRALSELEQALQKRRVSMESKEKEAWLLHNQKEAVERCRLLEQERDRLQRHEKELQQEREQLCEQLDQQRLDFAKQLTEAQQKSSAAETEHWRSMYEQLYAKVTPFMEQLNGFAAERDALLNEKGATQAELSKLADAYANLLGHQNQRQKIKHMVRLKEENLELKQEVSKLRSLVVKQKREVELVKDSQAPRKFDPSKAFKHKLKENMQPAADHK